MKVMMNRKMWQSAVVVANQFRIIQLWPVITLVLAGAVVATNGLSSAVSSSSLTSSLSSSGPSISPTSNVQKRAWGGSNAGGGNDGGSGNSGKWN